VSSVAERISVLEKRPDEVEKVNARLEQAALTTARALQKIAGHWDAVYEAMRREEEPTDEDEPSAESRSEEARASGPPLTGHQALSQRLGGPGPRIVRQSAVRNVTPVTLARVNKLREGATTRRDLYLRQRTGKASNSTLCGGPLSRA
jgi:hypothetical protein